MKPRILLFPNDDESEKPNVEMFKQMLANQLSH